MLLCHACVAQDKPRDSGNAGQIGLRAEPRLIYKVALVQALCRVPVTCPKIHPIAKEQTALTLLRLPLTLVHQSMTTA